MRPGRGWRFRRWPCVIGIGKVLGMRLLIAFLSLSLLVQPRPALTREVGVVSGLYDGGMMVGFDPATQMTTGYFSSETGQGQFTCIFYLEGKLQGSKVAVSTYFPGAAADLIPGQLTLDAPDRFRVRLKDEHGGCWNVMHFADNEQPANFTLDRAYPWISVAVIQKAKAYFYDAPGAATHRKGYIVKGDGVGVRATKPGWLQVDFVGGAKPVSGWIQQSDVFPAR